MAPESARSGAAISGRVRSKGLSELSAILILITDVFQDAANISSIRCVHHYHLVDLDPAHGGVYLELQQRVASSTFENLRTRNVDSEAERLIQEAICGSDDANEALLLRASHLKLTGEHLQRMRVEAAKAEEAAKAANATVSTEEDRPAGENDAEEAEEAEEAEAVEVQTSKRTRKPRKPAAKEQPTYAGQDDVDEDNAAEEAERAEINTSKRARKPRNSTAKKQPAYANQDDADEDDEVEEAYEPEQVGDIEEDEVVEVKTSKRVRKPRKPATKKKSTSADEETQASKPVDKKKSKKNKGLDLSEFIAPNEEVTTESMIRTRSMQLQKLLEGEGKLLKKAFWLQSQEDAAGCDRFDAWIKRLEKNDGFHDEESRNLLLVTINKAKLASTNNDWEEFYREKSEKLAEDDPRRQLPELPTGYNLNSNTAHLTKVAAHLRTTTVKLNRLGEVIVNHNRSLRFMKAIADIQGGKISCSLCNENTDPQDVTLLSGCGHAICPMHRGLLKDGADCPLYGCDAQIKDIQKFTGQQLCTNPRSGATKHGHKVDDIIKLIKKCKANGDKVLIFAQFPPLIEILLQALKDEGLTFDDLTLKAADKSSKLQAFQNPDNTHDGLILNPSGSSASGANLTSTNHIVFVHPLHTAGRGAQANWESTMIQAIGRARRYGQEKTVHVHHFLSVATVDIDCFEHRTGKFVRRKPGCPMGVGELVDRAEGAQSTLNSRIAHINYPDEPMTD